MLSICYKSRFFSKQLRKRQIDQLPEEMYSMLLAKNSLDDAIDPAKTKRAMNISTTLKHW